VIARALVVGAGAWVAWAWLPHLLTPACTWRGPRRGQRIALTFDDGPDAEWTPRVLDLLAAARARATFFLVGERAQRAPDVVRRMAADGHEIANHSWSHRSPWLCGPRATREEVARAHATLTELAGAPPRHFRPPWGMVNAALFAEVRRVGERFSAPRQVGYVLRHAHPGAIVDLHDAEGTRAAPSRLVEALPRMIRGLRDRGYTLTTVADLLSR